MKVLIFGTGTLDCAAANCGVALRAMGHDVRHFDPDAHPSYLAPLRRSWTTAKVVNRLLGFAVDYAKLWEQAFVREAAEFGPDLVLIIPISLPSPAAIRAVKERTGAKIAGWFQDHVVNFLSHDFLLADYDGLFFKDPYIIERLRDFCGIENVHFLPESCEPQIHHSLPVSDADRIKFGCDLMVYGNLYVYRARLLEHLMHRDIRFYAWHPGRWIDHPFASKWQGQPIFFDDKIKAVLSAKIIVNTSHFGEIHSTHARMFEVAGIGGFQVADAPGAADYFEPGTEIVTFKGPKELNEVIAHYLHRPEERRAIAARAQERADREHTYARRLTKLIETVGLETRPSVVGARRTGPSHELADRG